MASPRPTIAGASLLRGNLWLPVFSLLVFTPRTRVLAQQSSIPPSQGGPQPPTITLIGTTRDSAAHPLVGTLVTVRASAITTHSDSAGAFRLRGLTRGEHYLRFEQPGFAPLTVRVVLRSALLAEVNMGAVVLGARPVHVITLAGSVKDKLSEQAVEAVAVSVAGRLVGYSDAEGRFQVDSVALHDGALIQFRRIGYSPVEFELWPADSARDVNLAITLTPVAVKLGELVIEANRTSVLYPSLKDFEQHRKAGFGTFLTPERIAQLPSFSSVDLLRWAGGIVHGDIFSGHWVELFGAGHPFALCDGPVYFIDGRPYARESAMMMLEMWPPEQVLAVEVYKHAGGIPVEYNVTGAECGVIAYWFKW